MCGVGEVDWEEGVHYWGRPPARWGKLVTPMECSCEGQGNCYKVKSQHTEGQGKNEVAVRGLFIRIRRRVK